jgi:hypothetical protein
VCAGARSAHSHTHCAHHEHVFHGRVTRRLSCTIVMLPAAADGRGCSAPSSSSPQ